METGLTFIDGKGVGDVEEMVLRDRRRLAQDGIVIPLITIEKEYGKLFAPLEIITRGFTQEEESPEMIEEMVALLTEAIGAMDKEVVSDPDMLKAEARRVLRKHIRKKIERRPMVMPIIFEV